MANIDSVDISSAAETIGDRIRDALSGPTPGHLDGVHDWPTNVTGALFAIASSINRLAEAVEGLNEEA